MGTEKTQAICDINFESYYNGVKESVNSELQLLLQNIVELKLQNQIKYALKTQGKRLRATLVLLSGQCVGGKEEDLRRLALAIELLHLATLVHDDVLDEDLFRRNDLSVHAKWGIKEAVLVGDILASLSFTLCKGYKREILDVMIETCMELSDGEYSDVELVETVSEQEYFRRIKKKTASLFRAACECGVLASNGLPSEIEALRLFGENYGVAYQIRDDILDGETAENGKKPEVQNFSQAVPIQFHENASKIDLYVDKAVANLTSLKKSEFKQYLIEMAESLRIKEPKFGSQKIYL